MKEKSESKLPAVLGILFIIATGIWLKGKCENNCANIPENIPIKDNNLVYTDPLEIEKEPVVTQMPDGSVHIDRLGPGESVNVSVSTPMDLDKIFGHKGDIKITDLLDAIEQVESGGDSNAVGDCGEIGSFQISQIYVDDVNRIMKAEGHEPNWTYNDRWDRDYSRSMAMIYMGYWHNEKFSYRYFGRGSTIDIKTAERLARIHNGGPKGNEKDCTLQFWEKVKLLLL